MSDIDKIKRLRQSTGAGFKDCNSAIQEANGDLDKAVEILRVKGVAKASKKMSREANEGVIALSGDSKKFSVIEVNCETDFVARTEDFQQFASDVSMHIAASQPLAIKSEDIEAELIERERGIYSEQAKNEGKPEQIAEKIVQGRVEKFYQENCLLEQPFVKNPDQTIEQMITELTAKIGEKIGVSRFSCFRLGD